jgi:hypothetical protein
MNEKHFYADADTPFHVWVRERCAAHGYRWVLRHASQVMSIEQDTASSYMPGRDAPTPVSRRAA